MVKIFIKRIISPWDETDVNWTNAPFTTDNNQILHYKTEFDEDPSKLMSLD
jgi:hypothetical protein